MMRWGCAIWVEQDSELVAPLVATTWYGNNVNGDYIKATNPRGEITRTWYQNFDQPGMDTPVAIRHPESANTHIVRDDFGKPTRIRRSDSVSPVGGTVAIDRDYFYNAQQQLCRVREPETGDTFMGYDAAGNLAWSAAGYNSSAPGCLTAADVAARRADRGYDLRNRIVSLSFPDGRGNTTHTYTADGLPETVTVDNGGGSLTTTSYNYNRRRLMTSEVLAYTDVFSWAVDYQYNANGHRSAQSWHGITVDYAPNALGQPTKAGSYASNVSYYPNGAIKQFTYGNGIVHTLTQNARGLPDTSTDAYGGTAFLADSYDYDANGNVAAITDGATGTGQRGNRDMVYDGLDRLTGTTSPMFGTATYAYDVLDNLTRLSVSGSTAARDLYYCYGSANRLAFIRSGPVCTGSSASPAVQALTWDLQGNLADKSGQTFSFDYGNRLRDAQVGTVTSQYAYDGMGRRVWDYTTHNKFSQYLQSGELAMTVDQRKNIVTEYIYLGGSLIATRDRYTPTNTYTTKYHHTDALGSPVVITDANRTELERREYEPYGKQLTPTPQDGPGYTGHVFDAATGLVYAQQRYYDDDIGRFLSADPVTPYGSPVGQFNRYRYGNNNPYRFVDPDGRVSDKKERQAKTPLQLVDHRTLASKSASYTRDMKVTSEMRSGFTRESLAGRVAEATSEVNKVREVVGEVEKTKNAAANRFRSYVQPISTKYGVEIDGLVDEVVGGYRIDGLQVGGEFAYFPGMGYVGARAPGASYGLSTIHSHPFVGGGNGTFSSDDYLWMRSSAEVGRSHYVSNPEGLYRYKDGEESLVSPSGE